MKVLITGASGFIGSYFMKNYKDKFMIQTFSFRNNDFDVLKLNQIDVVVHLSALVHQMDGASKEEYERVNVSQTLALAAKAKDQGVKHFVFMSSIKVYGEENDKPYTEETPCNPQDEYGKSKLKAEQELQKLENDDFKVSIIRTPIVYGYGVKANIKNLVNLVKNVPILPFGKIENKRSMVYIGNLCYLIDEVIKQEQSGIFLASDDESVSTTKLIEMIANGLGRKVYLIKVPFFKTILKVLKPSFHKRLYENLEVDNTQTKKMLNFKNQFGAEEGIRHMIKGER